MDNLDARFDDRFLDLALSRAAGSEQAPDLIGRTLDAYRSDLSGGGTCANPTETPSAGNEDDLGLVLSRPLALVPSTPKRARKRFFFAAAAAVIVAAIALPVAYSLVGDASVTEGGERAIADVVDVPVPKPPVENKSDSTAGVRGKGARSNGSGAMFNPLVTDEPTGAPIEFYPPVPDMRAHADFFFTANNVRILRTPADRPFYTLNFDVVSGPAGFTINGPASPLFWTPTSAQVGTHEITIRVREYDVPGHVAYEATDTFTMTVDDNTMTYPAFRDYPRDQDVLTVLGRSHGNEFVSYSLDYRVDNNLQPVWVPIVGPIAVPVETTGPLGDWNISALPNGGRYVLRLTTQLSDGSQSVLENGVILDRTMKAGWSKRTPNPPIGGNVVMTDLDDDGKDEAILATFNEIWCWNIDGTLRWHVENFGASGQTTPSIGDITGDGVPEIVYVTYPFLYAYRPDGTAVPGFPMSRPASAQSWKMTPALADLDGDGACEILIGSQNAAGVPAQLFAFHYSSVTQSVSLLSGWPQTVDYHQTYASPSVADLDGDGGPEVVLSTKDRLWAWHANGASLAGWQGGVLLALPITGGQANGSSVGSGTPTSQPAIADIDGDGSREIIVGSNVLRADGTRKPGWEDGKVGTLWLTPSISPAVGEVDDNSANGLEIVLGKLIWHADGTLMNGCPPNFPDYNTIAFGSTVLGRCSDEGHHLDLMASTRNVSPTLGSGVVGWCDHFGVIAMNPAYPKNLFGFTGDPGAPVVGDFDNDGCVDVAVAVTDVGYGGVTAIYNMPVNNTDEHNHWRMLGFNPRHTGCYTVPSANRPTNLIATVVGDEVDLAWNDNSEKEDGYVVERSTTGAPWSYTTLAALPSDTVGFIVENPGVGVSFYRVRAVRNDPFGAVVRSVAAGPAQVDVPAQPVLTSITLTPATASMTTGQTQQFTAQGYDQYGAPIAAAMSWSSTGGSVTAGGLFTPPATPGTYTVTASSGLVSGNASAVVSLPALSLNDVSVTEGASGSVYASFTVSLNGPGADIVTVSYTTSNGSAVSGSDFASTTGSRTFTPGSPLSQTITVTILHDTRDEADETFNLVLVGPVNATLLDHIGVGTIVDNDPPPVLNINVTSIVTEGTLTVQVGFSASLSAASGKTVTVNYATGGGTATSGSDYAGVSGTFTFLPGETYKYSFVTVLSDAVVEPDETFSVTLSNAVNASIGTGSATCTITEVPPGISINDRTITEPSNYSGTPVTHVFTITLTRASGNTITVNYSTGGGTATAGSDYTSVTGTMTFAPGVFSQMLTVTVLHDTASEPDENYNLTLSNPVNVTIIDGVGVGTIYDNDSSSGGGGPKSESAPAPQSNPQ